MVPIKPEMPPLEGFLERIQECNTGLGKVTEMTPFKIDQKIVGQMMPEFVEKLSHFPQVFNVQGLGPSGTVALAPHLDTPDKRTSAVANVLRELKDQQVIKGWRDEMYPVTSSFYDTADMLIERAAVTHFGMKAYGVHCNGYVVDEEGRYSLWVARRSLSKPNWPGMLDHVVAGGQPHGISPKDNVTKECEEEASIPYDLAITARPVGAVSYTTVSATGFKPDVLFCFDIELPRSFTPKPQDGEVDEFMLWPVERVAQTVATTRDFKTNCNLVITDFLVRHGFITPDQPGYLEVVRGLRQGDCR